VTSPRTGTGRDHLRLVHSKGVKTVLRTPSSWIDPLELYRIWMRGTGRQPSTIAMRYYQLRRFAIACRRSPALVELDDIVTYLDQGEWSNSTRRAARSAIRGFFRWMQLTGRRVDDPAGLVPPPPPVRGVPRPAPDAALLAALSAAQPRERMMVRLAAEAGLRCCEICKVHTRDVAGGRGERTLRIDGKGGRVRIVPISDSLAVAILAHEPGYVFPGQIDGHLSAPYVSKKISRILPDHTAHTLRHRYATRALVGAGGNLRVVQELLGHANITTTQVYTAVEAHQLRQAALYAA
jgi:integrase/recombinase XerC